MAAISIFSLIHIILSHYIRYIEVAYSQNTTKYSASSPLKVLKFDIFKSNINLLYHLISTSAGEFDLIPSNLSRIDCIETRLLL